MSIFSVLFGGGSAATKTVETATGMMDNAFYTDQEKATNKNKMLDWYLKYQGATAPQNVARRMIALIVTALWATLIIVAVVAHLLETTHGNDSFSQFVFNTLKENVNLPFSIIIGFYFAAHVLRGLKNDK